jgi:hypothetical protein
MENEENDINRIVTKELVEDVITEALVKSKDKRRDKFILLWLLGFPAKSAALSAGYSESYAESGIQKELKNSDTLRARIDEITRVMPERYKALCRFRLGDVAEVEGKVLERMKSQPELAAKHPQLLRQVKESAGALESETPKTIQININELQAIINKNMTE